MSAKPLPEHKQRECIALRAQGLSWGKIGEQMGCSPTTVRKYCREASQLAGDPEAVEPKGGPTDEVNTPIDRRGKNGGETSIVTPERPRTLAEMTKLFGIDEKVWKATVFRANEWQGFYKIKDGSGHRKVNLWQTRVTWMRVMVEEVEKAILTFVREHVKPLPKPSLVKSSMRAEEGQMVAWGLWDAHLGMHAWHSEVGQDWDLKIASKRIFNSIDDMMVELKPYPIAKILMPIGNDFMHFDNVRHKTSFGEQDLDTDNRFGKVFLQALRCLSYQVERALEICDDVEIIYVPGNHDMSTSFCLTAALNERFKDDPRFSADLGFNPRKYRVWGETLLGFEHGQKCKPQQLAMVMAEECREDWHRCRYREIQIGHTHQRREMMFQTLTPTNGVLIRTNPSLCNVDSWHHSKGFIGEPTKSVEAWRYSKVGYIGSHVAWTRDDRSE